MFLIWGSKGFMKDLGSTSVHCNCKNCNNDVTLRGRNIGRKFTFFWIPLFKIISKYYMVCPICDYGHELSKKEVYDKCINV